MRKIQMAPVIENRYILGGVYRIIKTMCVNNKYCYSSSWTLRNNSDKTCRECKDILRSIIFFFENLAVYWIMWKNTVQ